MRLAASITISVLVAALPVSGADEGAQALGSGIVSPDADQPAEQMPGGAIEALVSVRLPMTPPPGVQQSRALQGWEVRLRRAASYAFDKGSNLLDYKGDLIRIRPHEDRVYRFTVGIAPWIPTGCYDLVVRGHGVSSSQPRAVSIGKGECLDSKPGALVEPTADDGIFVRSSSGGDARVVADLVVPGEVPGLVAVSGLDRIEPVQVVWAETPGDLQHARTVLRYEIDVSGSGGKATGAKVVKLSRAAGEPCSAKIAWKGEPDISAGTEWRDLEIDTGSAKVVSVVWDFGDGKWGYGKKVRHRWLLVDKAVVKATAFDEAGRRCEARLDAVFSLRSQRSGGCGCDAVGADGKLQITGLFDN